MNEQRCHLIVELRVLLVVQDGCIRLLGEQRTTRTTIDALTKMQNEIIKHERKMSAWSM